MNPARTRMGEIGNLFAAHASQFGYSEDPVLRAVVFNLTYEELVARLEAGETITGDCSSTAEATRKDAGCINLPPLGYTGTELQTMPHIPLAEALEGDFIVFGPGTGLHVVWIASAHPTNPKVHSGPFDPKIDSHGQPGFQQTDLLTMWNEAFPGQPITVLSQKPFLPPVPSYHYDYYDEHVVKLPHGRNSERNVVENYDKARKHPVENRAQLEVIETNLAQLVTNLQDAMARSNDPHGLKFHRAYREPRLVARANGEVVEPDLD